MAQAFVIATTTEAETAGGSASCALCHPGRYTPFGCRAAALSEPYPNRSWTASVSSLVNQGSLKHYQHSGGLVWSLEHVRSRAELSRNIDVGLISKRADPCSNFGNRGWMPPNSVLRPRV